MDTLKRVPTNASQDSDANGSPLTAVLSDPSHTKTSPRLAGRSNTTHNLLAVNNGADVRRGAQIETTTTNTNRASISMPNSVGKPSIDRRLSVSLSTAPRLPRRSEDGTGAASPPSSILSFDDRQQFSTSLSVPTTATDTTSITTNSVNNLPGLPVLSPPLPSTHLPNESPLVQPQSSKMSTSNDAVKSPPLARTESLAPAGPALFSIPKSEGPSSDSGALPARGPRGTTSRTTSTTRRLSRTTSKENSVEEAGPRIGKVGVCALDVKARSRPSRQILTRLQNNDDFEVIVFGDKVILDEGM